MPPHYPKESEMVKVKAPSRPQRWMDAVNAARAAIEDVNGAMGTLGDCLRELQDIQSEYEEWRDNLPDSLSGSATADKLEEVVDLEIDPDSRDLDAIEEMIDNAEGIDLPLGFGRD